MTGMGASMLLEVSGVGRKGSRAACCLYIANKEGSAAMALAFDTNSGPPHVVPPRSGTKLCKEQKPITESEAEDTDENNQR